MKAVEIMSTPAVSVTARTSVRRAAQILREHGFSALPVIDHAGTLIGVVSEADLIKDRFAGPDVGDARSESSRRRRLVR